MNPNEQERPMMDEFGVLDRSGDVRFVGQADAIEGANDAQAVAKWADENEPQYAPHTAHRRLVTAWEPLS